MKKIYNKFHLLYILSLLLLVNGDFNSDNCKSYGWSCLNCKNLKMCFGGTLWETKKCSDTLANSTLKYCDPKTNQCVAEEPVECKTTTEFICPSNGLYPNLQNCSSYVKCTDGVKKEMLCKTNEYFRVDWGRCLPKLTNSDCKIVKCSLTDSQNSLQNMSPLYYDCKGGLLGLKFCPESEYFDNESKSCIKVCKNNSGLILEDLKDCSTYYTCNINTLNLVNNVCPSGKGFNSVTKQCEINYDRMCNEMSLLDKSLFKIINKIPILAQINNIVRSIFKLFKYNPLTLILKFNINNELLTKIILTINYFSENNKIPSGIIRDLTDGILKFLPKPIRDIIETILKFIPMGKTLISKRSVGNESNLEMSLIHFLQNLQIDNILNIINILQYKNLTEIKILTQNYLVDIYDLSQEQVLIISNTIASNLYVIVRFLNENIGFDLFEVKNGGFHISLNNLDKNIDIKINDCLSNPEFNYMLAELLKNVYRNIKSNMFNNVKLFSDL